LFWVSRISRIEAIVCAHFLCKLWQAVEILGGTCGDVDGINIADSFVPLRVDDRCDMMPENETNNSKRTTQRQIFSHEFAEKICDM
jgi:hypothetical protein